MISIFHSISHCKQSSGCVLRIGFCNVSCFICVLFHQSLAYNDEVSWGTVSDQLWSHPHRFQKASGLKNLNLTRSWYMHRKVLPLFRLSRAIALSTVIVLASRYLIISFKILDYFAVIPIMEQYTDSEAAQIGITTMFGIVVTIDLIGNILVCLVILLYRDMRWAKLSFRLSKHF